jgi:hypothetical protein
MTSKYSKEEIDELVKMIVQTSSSANDPSNPSELAIDALGGLSKSDTIVFVAFLVSELASVSLSVDIICEVIRVMANKYKGLDPCTQT